MGRYEEIRRILRILEHSHAKIHCMLIVPEALDANGEPTDPGNKLMKNQIAVWLDVSVYSQTEIDAGTWNPTIYDVIVLGSDNTTAWTLTNIDDLVSLHIPKICVTRDVAIKLLIGTDGGNTGAQTTIYVDNVMNQALKDAGIYSVGDQTVLSTARAIQMLNMSDADLVEELIAVDAVGSSGDNTKCITAYCPKFARDGSINTNINGDDLAASVMYIGYGKWFADATALGKYLFEGLIHVFLHEAISVSLFVRELGATTFVRLFGNMAGSFSNKNPLVEFIAGKDSVGTRNPVGKSWRDIIGIGYLDAGGGFGTDNVAADLLAIKASTDIRRIASGSKTIGTGVTKYLSIDSGTNGVEIIGVVIKGVVSADWTLDVYIPTADGVGAPAAGDKRDTNAYANTDTEGGLLSGFIAPYNCFLNFTNDSAGDDNIDDVVILYRSAAALTLTWET